MNVFEHNIIDVLCAPGIQSHPDDWEFLQRETNDFLRMHIADEQPEATGLTHEEWISKTISYEADLIREHAINVVFAHSFATHRTLKTLKETPTIDAAFFFNPARNEMLDTSDKTPCKTDISELDGTWLRKESETFMEKLMWQPALDMNDSTFRKFSARHEARYNEKRRHIRTQFNFLSKGPTFAEQLEEYKEQTPIFIFQSADDPWHTGALPHKPQVRTIALPEKTRHYAHVSLPQYISRVVWSRLTELGILTSSTPISVESNFQTVTV